MHKLFSSADLRRLIIPLIFEQALAMTVGMADTVMISAVGEAAVSGVSLVDMINNLVLLFSPHWRQAVRSSPRSTSVQSARSRPETLPRSF